jgi:hypothetical protein
LTKQQLRVHLYLLFYLVSATGLFAQERTDQARLSVRVSLGSIIEIDSEVRATASGEHAVVITVSPGFHRVRVIAIGYPQNDRRDSLSLAANELRELEFNFSPLLKVAQERRGDPTSIRLGYIKYLCERRKLELGLSLLLQLIDNEPDTHSNDELWVTTWQCLIGLNRHEEVLDLFSGKHFSRLTSSSSLFSAVVDCTSYLEQDLGKRQECDRLMTAIPRFRAFTDRVVSSRAYEALQDEESISAFTDLISLSYCVSDCTKDANGGMRKSLDCTRCQSQTKFWRDHLEKLKLTKELRETVRFRLCDN